MWKHPNEVKNYNKFNSVFDTAYEEKAKDEKISLFEWDVERQPPSDEEIRIIGWEKYIIEK
ncbi:hypothetical protein ACJ2A9_23170 [Anaerobacillus sp. MEB173]|uniref:hypothetical protein n=1 Tax=Anaerobacillus sp. MEB173 TaxID=3383345 RepID=UPI003F914F30